MGAIGCHQTILSKEVTVGEKELGVKPYRETCTDSNQLIINPQYIYTYHPDNTQKFIFLPGHMAL